MCLTLILTFKIAKLKCKYANREVTCDFICVYIYKSIDVNMHETYTRAAHTHAWLIKTGGGSIWPEGDMHEHTTSFRRQSKPASRQDLLNEAIHFSCSINRFVI